MSRCTIILCYILTLSVTTVFSQTKAPSALKEGNWSAKMADGWLTALDIRTNTNNQKTGSFFWLFDKQPIQWELDDNTLTIQFKDAWHQYSEDSSTLEFKITPDGLLLVTESMTEAEKKQLTGLTLKKGGRFSHQLADSSNDNSPYSLYHERSFLKLDPNIITPVLASIAVKVFQSESGIIRTLVRHKKLPISLLRQLIATCQRTKPKDNRKSVSPWEGSKTILLQISDHPSLERKDLDIIWKLPFSYWEPSMWWRAANHPQRNPNWINEFKERINVKSKEGQRMRSILARNQELNLEIIDILIESLKTDPVIRNCELANHPKLDETRIRKLYSIKPYSSASPLAHRADIPLDIQQKILNSKNEDAIVSMLREAKFHPSVLSQAAQKISRDDDLNIASSAFESAHLSPERIQELLLHTEPSVLSSLAKNPNLPLTDLKELTEHNYQIVAQTARRSYVKRVGDEAKPYLAKLKKLSNLLPHYSIESEIREAISKDKLKKFLKLLDRLWLPLGKKTYDSRFQRWAEIAIRNKAYGIINQWFAEKTKFINHLLTSQAHLWDQEIISIILDNEPTNEQLEKCVVSLLKANRSDLLDIYLKRGFSLEAAKKQPLVYFAIANRNTNLARKLLKAGCDPSISFNRNTPSMLAIQMNYTEALEFLPMDETKKKTLQAFKAQYPGDSNAAWLGIWSNGKSEFKTLVIHLLADGSGKIITATGSVFPVAWKTVDKDTVQIIPIMKGKAVESQIIQAKLKKEVLLLQLPKNRTEKMRRIKTEEVKK